MQNLKSAKCKSEDSQSAGFETSSAATDFSEIDNKSDIKSNLKFKVRILDRPNRVIHNSKSCENSSSAQAQPKPPYRNFII